MTGLNVRSAPPDVLSRLHFDKDLNAAIGIAVGFFDHHDRVGAVRHRRAGRDLDALAGGNGRCGHLPRIQRGNLMKAARLRSTGAACISRPHGVAVHRGARKRRHVGRRHHVARDHAARGLLDRHLLDARNRCAGSIDEGARLVEGNRFSKWPHCSYRESSRTRWPSSGRMSLVMASRTAFSEPGSEMISLHSAVPAHARLNMAAGPIS